MASARKQGRLRGPQLPKAGVDVLCSAQLLKDRDQVQQLSVCHVIKPRLHGHLAQGKGSVTLTASASLPWPRAPGGWPGQLGGTLLWRSLDSTPHSFPSVGQGLPGPAACVWTTHRILRVEDVRRGRVVQNEGLPQVPSQAAEVLDIAALVEHAGLPEQAGPEHATPVQQIRHWVGILEAERMLLSGCSPGSPGGPPRSAAAALAPLPPARPQVPWPGWQ